MATDWRGHRAMRLPRPLTRNLPCSVLAILAVFTVAWLVTDTADAAAGSVTTTAPALPGQAAPSSTTDVNAELSDVNNRIDSLYSTLLLPVGLLITLIAGGSFIGVVATLRSERRAAQLHDLAVSSETATQLRAEQVHVSFLDASQKTLTLVNDTLALAKEASERAARTMALKAHQSLDSVDENARDVLDKLRGSGYKRVVEEPQMRSDLLEVAHELASIEGYLQLQDIELTPACFFVKGMERHLKQEARLAIRYLREAVQRSKDRDLSTLAQFWIGYEANNRGEYSHAIEAFRRAAESETRSTSRYFELCRILIESRFFEYATQSGASDVADNGVDDFAIELAKLEKEIPNAGKDFETVRRNILTTHGTLLHHAGVRAESDERRESCLRQSIECFTAAGDGLWATFGGLEAKVALNGVVSSEDNERYQEVIEIAVEQLSRRLEPRSLTLLHATRLISEIRQKKEIAEVDGTFRDLLTALTTVDRGMTVYSQFQRHNISWEAFKDEAQSFYMEYSGRSKRNGGRPPTRGRKRAS
jgi:tetratricopeptide (TPR) repeat protein